MSVFLFVLPDAFIIQTFLCFERCKTFKIEDNQNSWRRQLIFLKQIIKCDLGFLVDYVDLVDQ